MDAELSPEQNGLDRFVAFVGNLAVFFLKKIQLMDGIAKNIEDDLKKHGMWFLNQEEEEQQQLAPLNRTEAMKYEGNDTQPELRNPLESTVPLQQEPSQGWEAEQDSNGGVTLTNYDFKKDLMAMGDGHTSEEAAAMITMMRKIEQARHTGYA